MSKSYSFKASPEFLSHFTYILTHPLLKVITSDISICHDRIIFPEKKIADFDSLQKLIDDKEVFICGDCGGKQICHALMKKPSN